ncbi:MAG: glycosyltransferase family 2 protein [Solirubrobacterales bacterium]|nr:glycosyltransferase family 2 protein [Solirubrobacterales bacterium]
MSEPSPEQDQPSVSYVIVAYESGPELARTLPGLAREIEPGDEVIVVDNGSKVSPRDMVAEHLPAATVIEMGANAGFTAATNRGATASSGDIVLMLNPDALPETGFGAAIREPFRDRPDWGAWMALVACRIDGEKVVNSWANPVHFTGIAWAGGHGRPLSEVGGEGDIPIASGAALAVRREVWEEVGGLPEEFFLYHEDIDISVRIQAAGRRIGLQPAAVVDHDYDFHSNDRKWFWLERNRIAMVIRNYPGPLLALVSPALLATELVILLVSAKQGWVGAKLKSYRDLTGWLPRLRGERHEIQAARRITASEFADLLTPDLDSQLIPAFARKGLVRGLLRAYWKAVRAILR